MWQSYVHLLEKGLQWAFFNAFGTLEGPKAAPIRLKISSFHLFVHPNQSRITFGKTRFLPIFTHFWSQKGPFSRHFGIFHGPKHVTTGSKRAKSTCCSILNGSRLVLEKHLFDPFFSHFGSQNCPFSRHFGIFRGPERITTSSKRAKNTCLSIPSGLQTTLEKIFFFALETLVEPPMAPMVRGPSCPMAPPHDHWYGGLGVSLGEFEAWK